MAIASRKFRSGPCAAKPTTVPRIHPRFRERLFRDRSLDLVTPMEHDLKPGIGLSQVVERGGQAQIPHDTSGKPARGGKTASLVGDPLAMCDERNGGTGERRLVTLIAGKARFGLRPQPPTPHQDNSSPIGVGQSPARRIPKKSPGGLAQPHRHALTPRNHLQQVLLLRPRASRPSRSPTCLAVSSPPTCEPRVAGCRRRRARLR